MVGVWCVVLGTILCTGIDGHYYDYRERIDENQDVPEECSRDMVVKIGPYSYLPTRTNEFCYVPSKLMFDAHGNLFAILEDNNDEHPYKAYVKTKQSNNFELIRGVNDRLMVCAAGDHTEHVYKWGSRLTFMLGKSSVSGDTWLRLDAGAVQGLAYDNRSHKIYFATEDGIYVYVLTLSLRYELASYAFDGIDIVDIDFDKDGKLYLATYKNKKMYTVEQGNEKKPVSRVPNATYFKMDREGNFYFIVDDYFYVLWVDESEPRKIPLVPDTGYKSIAFDGEGNGYLAYNEGLLFLKYGSKEFVKVQDLYGAVTSIAIDSNGDLALGYRKNLFKFTKIGKC